MSYRNEIADDIVTVLRDIKNPRIGLVSRDPVVVQELANSQFPCILIELARESREDLTMGNSNTRSGTLEVVINGYTQGVNIDEQRNSLIEAIEDQLEGNRRRNTYAKNSRITSIELQPSVPPFGVFTMTYEVFYTYTRGNS